MADKQINHSTHLELDKCPLCGTAHPTLTSQWGNVLNSHDGSNPRYWATYLCSTCGGLVTAASPQTKAHPINEIYPANPVVDTSIPEMACNYLKQANDSLHAPAGAVLLAASAIDAMLKDHGYKDGSLYDRIDRAVKEHLLTDGMGEWAHQVRLDANDQRHADQASTMPDQNDAKRSISFAMALGEILYVLPEKVKAGIKDSAPGNQAEKDSSK